MLVLDRRIGQQILIGEGVIQIKVLKVNDGVISIGIDAPPSIDVDREEVYLRKLIQRNTAYNTGALA